MLLASPAPARLLLARARGCPSPSRLPEEQIQATWLLPQERLQLRWLSAVGIRELRPGVIPDHADQLPLARVAQAAMGAEAGIGLPGRLEELLPRRQRLMEQPVALQHQGAQFVLERRQEPRDLVINPRRPLQQLFRQCQLRQRTCLPHLRPSSCLAHALPSPSECKRTLSGAGMSDWIG